ncbi:MAG: HPF/RaiA family ribosome-associated protein [Steroidobacter sp.]
MQIQVNTDNHVHGSENLIGRVQEMVEGAVSHFSERITRIEVHLSDENSAKGGADDKRCMLEARLGGLEPIAVTHQAESLQLAIDGAAEKLEKAIGHTVGRLNER